MAGKNFEVAIVGGGITGVTLAIALHHRSIPVKVYEQAPAFGEIGAGVSFSPNAVQAMRECHQGVYEAFEKVCTRNLWPSKQKVWFDYLDGWAGIQNGDLQQATAFTISNSLGQNGVHRARFLDEMVKLIPDGVAQFGKRLSSLSENDKGRIVMSFEDGSTAETDAVIGCDGIKSKVRQIILGADHPSANPSYTHKYAYRGLVPMEQAIAAIGEEHAQNACMHVSEISFKDDFSDILQMGPDGHVLTFPVNHGKTLNIVAFRTTQDEWPDTQRLTKPAERKELLRDFEGYGHSLIKLLELTKPDLDIVSLQFHLLLFLD